MRLVTFKCLRKSQVHVEVKATEHSYHSLKYIILEAKHGCFIYLIINCYLKTNHRDHEKVLLTRFFISFKESSVLSQGILVRCMRVPMHN